MLKVRIITPIGIAYEGEGDEVVLPAMTGQIGVRTGHRALITALKKGTVRIKNGGNERGFEVSGGFADISGTQITVTSRASTQARP